jgi:hypothetical protein
MKPPLRVREAHPAAPPRPGVRSALIGIHAFTAANALAGAWYALAGAPDVPKEWLEHTPFQDYRIPGAVLAVAVGGGQIAAFAALMRRDRHAKPLSTAAAGVLLAWIATQLAMIGYRSPLQPAVLASAVGTVALSRRLDG